MPPVLYLLTLAVFATGTSEFMLAGLVPRIAADLGVDVGTAGLLTSGFAAGMVVGAPLVAALARRWPPRRSLLAALVLFVLAHVVGALTDDFGVLLATRVVAALASAGLLAVALTVATRAVPLDRTARALAVLLSGTTAAMVAGVPGGALLGELLGWRATFWAVAVLCLPAALGIALAPVADGAERADAVAPSLRRELRELRRGRLLLVMALGALVNAATFGALTFLSPVVTDLAGLGEGWVPVALALLGLGALGGLTVAGRVGDRHGPALLALGGPSLLLAWVSLALLADHPAALLPGVLLVGALSFAVGATLIARVVREATAAPTMAGSCATAALNLGALLGPVLAAVALTTDLRASGPLWTSAALVALALGLATTTPAARPR